MAIDSELKVELKAGMITMHVFRLQTDELHLSCKSFKNALAEMDHGRK